MRYVQTIALSKKHEEEGTIALNFADKADMTRDGYFSMTLYYRSDAHTFIDTDYFHGISIYAKFINSEPFFANVGLIIYTDKDTYQTLEDNFHTYPKVIIAVVNWPRFGQSRGKFIEGTILRTLRYQAQDHFKGAWIAVRDADTIFAYEINNCLKVLVGDILTEISESSNAAERLEQYMPLLNNDKQLRLLLDIHKATPMTNKEFSEGLLEYMSFIKGITDTISRLDADKLMTNPTYVKRPIQ
jgi:hypothetical protein